MHNLPAQSIQVATLPENILTPVSYMVFLFLFWNLNGT